MKQVTIVELTTKTAMLADHQEYFIYRDMEKPLYHDHEVSLYDFYKECKSNLITIPVYRFCKQLKNDYGIPNNEIPPWEVKYSEEFISYTPEVWKCLNTFRESIENKLTHEKYKLECVERELRKNIENLKRKQRYTEDQTCIVVAGLKGSARKYETASLWSRIKYLFTRRID